MISNAVPQREQNWLFALLARPHVEQVGLAFTVTGISTRDPATSPRNRKTITVLPGSSANPDDHVNF